MPDNKLKWTNKTEKYANGERGKLGKWTVFETYWNTLRQEKKWSMLCFLPGIKRNLGDYMELENAHAFAEEVLMHWAIKAGVTFYEYNPPPPAKVKRRKESKDGKQARS